MHRIRECLLQKRHRVEGPEIELKVADTVMSCGDLPKVGRYRIGGEISLLSVLWRCT